MSGRIVLTADLDVLDMSIGGMRFKCRRRILPQSTLTLDIHKGGAQVSVQGTVVRSILRGVADEESGGGQIYEVAVTFGPMTDREKEALRKILSLIGTS